MAVILRALAAPVLVVSTCADAAAQSFYDLTMVRNRPPRFAQALEFNAGVSGGLTDDDLPALGYTDELGVDGYVWYHNHRFSSREAVLDAYVGRDGAFLGIKENSPAGKASRLELTGRYFAFGREGFYQDKTYVPTGRYDVDDYGFYLAFGRNQDEGLHVEGGGYMHWYRFGRNEDTDPAYTLSEDYWVFGVRTAVEHNTLQLDRTYGRELAGFIATLHFEVEQNSQDNLFGTPLWMSRLPSNVWRLRGHLEYYVPQSDLGVWVIRARGRYADREDRVFNFQAEELPGHIWIDGELGLRIDIGALAITPFGVGQWVKTLSETGFSAGDEFFFGGGGRLDLDLGDALSLYGEYSYVNNPARQPISADVDTLGEHQFFAGVKFRIGATRM